MYRISAASIDPDSVVNPGVLGAALPWQLKIVASRRWRRLASSRRAYMSCATPCNSFSPISNGRSSSKCYSRSRSGSHSCVWGLPPPAAERRPAAVQQSEDESLFSMVPPWGHDGAHSNYHRSRRPICPQQSRKLLIFHGESPTNTAKAAGEVVMSKNCLYSACSEWEQPRSILPASARRIDPRSGSRRPQLRPRPRERLRPRAFPRECGTGSP